METLFPKWTSNSFRGAGFTSHTQKLRPSFISSLQFGKRAEELGYMWVGRATCKWEGLWYAYITVLPQARDAEGLQEITATQEQDAQLYRRQTGRKETPSVNIMFTGYKQTNKHSRKENQRTRHTSPHTEDPTHRSPRISSQSPGWRFHLTQRDKHMWLRGGEENTAPRDTSVALLSSALTDTLSCEVESNVLWRRSYKNPQFEFSWLKL